MRRLSYLLFVLVVFLPSWTARGQDSLSETEQNIVRIVHEINDQSLALLEKTVNINSGTMNYEGVRAVADIFDAEFGDLGFITEWVPGDGFSRSGHLFARRRGTGPHLLLIGHLDTVFEADSPFQKYLLTSDSTASGPGTTDMKGGDVIIIAAIRALKMAGLLDRLSITVAFLGDEESTGKPLDLSRAALMDAADEADIAIAFEDGDDSFRTAVIARRGFTNWTLTVHARPAHSSVIFSENIGAGAIFETARILNGFYTEMSGEEYLTFNPGSIVGGTQITVDAQHSRGTAFGKSNVIAEHASVTGDLRTISIEQRESAKARMRAVVSSHLPGGQATIEFRDSSPPLSPTEGNRRLLAMLDKTSRDLGYGPVTAVNPGEAGAADISYTAGRVEMALDGLGLMGKGGHTVKEEADLNTLPMQTARAAILFYRLSLDAQAR